MSTQKVNEMINKQSGLVGISGVSSDMRDVLSAMEQGNDRAGLAVEMFANRIKRYVGAYFAELEGADLVVFTGGIGEHEPPIRRRVLKGLQGMGIDYNSDANEACDGKDAIISNPSSKVKIVVACTDEELVIASDTFRLLHGGDE